MARWTKICCALDFAEQSREAMREAALLAQRDGASLTLLHVFPWSATAAATETMAFTPAEVRERVRGEFEPQLAAAKAEAEAVAPGVAVETELSFGVPADEIIRLADERDFDLLVVGTHGRKGLRRLMLGSVAERVVRESPVPVFVFRPRRAPSAD